MGEAHHIMEGKLLYSQSTDFSVNLIPKVTSLQKQPESYLTKYRGTMALLRSHTEITTTRGSRTEEGRGHGIGRLVGRQVASQTKMQEKKGKECWAGTQGCVRPRHPPCYPPAPADLAS